MCIKVKQRNDPNEKRTLFYFKSIFSIHSVSVASSSAGKGQLRPLRVSHVVAIGVVVRSGGFPEVQIEAVKILAANVVDASAGQVNSRGARQWSLRTAWVLSA